MYTLCLDTSHKKLVIAVYKDDELIGSYEEYCERNQSENVFPQLIALLQKYNINKKEIKEIVVSKGPGSYTGVRIAMTIAKVIASLKKVKLYTISTLQLYKVKDASIIDAKGGKVFIGLENDFVMSLEEARMLLENKKVSGDTTLLGLDQEEFSVTKQFILKKPQWEKVEDVDNVSPMYLKEAI